MMCESAFFLTYFFGLCQNGQINSTAILLFHSQMSWRFIEKSISGNIALPLTVRCLSPAVCPVAVAVDCPQSAVSHCWLSPHPPWQTCVWGHIQWHQRYSRNRVFHIQDIHTHDACTGELAKWTCAYMYMYCVLLKVMLHTAYTA